MPYSNRSRKLIYILSAAAGFLAAGAWVVHAVFTSTSSTAAIGLLLVPVYGGLAALAACAVVYVGFAVADLRAGRLAWRSGRVFAASAFVAAALSSGSALLLQRDALSVASDPQSRPEDLIAVSQRWIPLWRDEVLFTLAKNPSAPPALLAEMAVQGRSSHLLSLIGAHPSTPQAVLEAFADGPRSYERDAGLAENPRITAAIAAQLAAATRTDFRDDLEYKLYQTFVLAALARNPATPQAVFDRLAAWEKPAYFLAVAVIFADRANCAQIARAGETDGGNAVLRNTAQSQLRQRGCPG
jgi:hypothetical protein